MQQLEIMQIKKDFPILSRKINGKGLIYLDNSATTQKPLQVIEAMNEYYKTYNANVHRGIHKLSEEATLAYEEAHQKVANFINAQFEEIIFTKNTTESLNLLAYSLSNEINENDEIIISQMEHHSNIVPWQQLAKRKKAKLHYAKITDDGKLDLDHLNSLINNKTKIVSLTHMSNVLGTINPVKEMGKIAHDNNALFVVDGAQSVPHFSIDIKKINCDFLCFSGHKMLGPTGIGVLFGKKELLEDMSPFLFGGDMIKEVKFNDSIWNDLPWKFEAGTPNIAEGIGLGVAIDYLKKIGMENVEEHGKNLVRYGLKKLDIEHVEIYGPKSDRGPVLSFNCFDKQNNLIHAHDVSSILDTEGIAIRGGHHCAMPLMSILNINGSARASLYIYNTKEDIDRLIEGLDKVKKIFNKEK